MEPSEIYQPIPWKDQFGSHERGSLGLHDLTTDGEGCTNKRHVSPPVAERRQRPHSQLLPKEHAIISFRLGNNGNLRGDHPLRSPNGQSVLKFGPLTKDVDFFESKMQDMSHPARKRKHHRHSSDLSSPTVVRGSSQPHSEEEVDSPVSPFNRENEGVATSCKRVKTSRQGSGRNRHSSNFKHKSQSRSELREGAEGAVEQITLEQSPNRSDIDGETGNQGKTVSRKRAVGRDGSPKSDDLLAEYGLPPRQLSNCRPLVPLYSAAVVPGIHKMVGGPKKTGKNLGSFMPQNSLRGNRDSSTISRPPKPKFFDFYDYDYQRPMDDSPAMKRRKLENERLPRRDSSNSVVSLSGEGSHVGMTESVSSLGSRPIKAELGANNDGHRRRPDLRGLGAVPEFHKTEAMMSCSDSKPRKSVQVKLEKTPSRGATMNTSGRPSRLVQPRASSENPTNPTQDTKAMNSSTSIQKDDVGDIPEMRPSPEMYQSAVNGASKNEEAAEGAIRNVEGSKKVSESSLKSRYFDNPQRRNESDVNESHGDATTSRYSSSRTPMLVSERATNDSRGRSSAMEDDQSHDDSIDLLDPNANPVIKNKKIEVQIITRRQPRNYFARSTSQSISTEGDIPQSVIAQTRPRTWKKTRHISNAGNSFDFVFLKSGTATIDIEKGCEPWQLKFNDETRVLDIMANGELITNFPGLILKPDKILKIKYNERCGKVFLFRNAETGSHSGGTHILVEMHDPSYGAIFVEYLQTINQSIKTNRAEGPEYMDRIFAYNEAQSTNTPPQTERKPLDVDLLEKKEARLAARGHGAQEGRPNRVKSLVEEDHPANVRRQRSNTAEDDISVGWRRRDTLASKMTKNVEEVLPVQTRPSRTLPFYDAESSILLQTAVINPKNLDEHRSSTRAAYTRQQNDERILHSPKPRSPSPVRWTERHPDWMEDEKWKSSLVFPAEGRKQQAIVVAEDIVRLDAGNFLNDNLIALYLRYLEDRLERSNPELAKRIYFQNTFFYASLTKGKVRSNNINYEAVKRWSTKAKVDIFSFDYIVVPVNENLHWYVAIIYNAPKLLRPEQGENQLSEELGGQAKLHTINAADVHVGSDEDTSTVYKFSGFGNSEQVAANPTDRMSASPSVTVQVEQMSLEDTTEDWPEPDAMPNHKTPEMVQLKRKHGLPPPDVDLQDAASEPKDSPSQTQTKKKVLRRKSMPMPRKHNINDPKIITLDSLGGTHSPTCSNLLEYLVCEGRARHGVEIQARRLGMTAKGLPQQSNHCDCGIFVLGYMERFLKDPDNFVQEILLGDMAPDKGWDEMNAPEMRENIRDLIFDLQRKQFRREHEQRALRSKSKKAARVEAQASESSKYPTRVTKSASTASSKAATPIDLSVDSIDLLPPKQQMVVVMDDDEIDNARPLTPNYSIISPVEIEDEDVVPVLELKTGTKLDLRNILAAKGIRRKAAPIEREIVEPSTLRSQHRKTPKLTSYDTAPSSVEVEPRSTSVTNRPSKSRAKSEEPLVPGSLSNSRERNVTKRYGKASFSSPYQNTRNKSRYGSNVDNPLAIDELEGLEIPESPLQQASPEIEFRDISELP